MVLAVQHCREEVPVADTIRGDFGDTPCSDCGGKGNVCVKHWGPLVPSGKIGFFDQGCLNARVEDYEAGRRPRPLGQKAA